MARTASYDTTQSAARDQARRQADARGVPADIMMPRVLLTVATVLLVLLGLVMVFSASTIEAISQGDSIFSYVSKQALFVAVGGVAAFAIAKFVPYHVWQSGPWFWIAWGVSMLMLLAVPIIGTEIYGAQRWIYIGPVSIQPTEFAKIALVVAAAGILYRYRNEFSTLKDTLIAATILVIVPLAFLYKTQSDMGSAIVILLGVFAVMWIGEVPLRVLAPIFVAVVLVGVVGMVGYRADRVAVWLDPWNDGEGGYGTGYQMIRAFYAFAEGGLFGVGLGNSREKFLYLPEAETDFIFAVIGEELGLVGALFVIALFMVVLYAGLRIAHHAPDNFGATMAGGLTVMLVGQAFLNMACATGLFPTTGKPLPFISSGGSSVIASLVIVGLIMSVSVGSNVLTPYERRRNDLNVIRVERPESRRERSATQGAAAESRGRKDASRALSSPARGAGGLSGRRLLDAGRKDSRSERGGAPKASPSSRSERGKGGREASRANADARRAERRERARRRARDDERRGR